MNESYFYCLDFVTVPVAGDIKALLLKCIFTCIAIDSHMDTAICLCKHGIELHMGLENSHTR